MPTNFNDENLDDFGEIEPQEKKPDPSPRLEPKPDHPIEPHDPNFDPHPEEPEEEEPKPKSEKPKKKKPKKKKLNQVKVVGGINTWVFQGPTEVARGLTRVRMGNLLKVIEYDPKSEWIKVEVPRTGENIVGYIHGSRVKKV